MTYTTLLVDTNQASYSLYKELCGFSSSVCVVGRNYNDALVGLSTEHTCLDYSDYMAFINYVVQNNFRYIVPGCNYISYYECSILSHWYDNPFIDNLFNCHTIHNKSSFRDFALKHSIPSPALISFKDVLNYSSVMIKPADSFSGKGVHKFTRQDVQCLEKLVEYAKSYSPSNTVILEEFVAGQLYSYSSFICSCKVVQDFVVREDCAGPSRYAVNCSYVDYNFPRDILLDIRKEVEKIASLLGLCDGLLHVQLIFDGQNISFIEVMRRCPGDCYPLLIEYSTGYPYSKAYISPFIHQIIPINCSILRPHEWIIRHTIHLPVGVPLWAIKFLRPVSIKLFIPLASAGDSACDQDWLRVAIVFFASSSEDEHNILYEQLLANQLYTYSVS